MSWSEPEGRLRCEPGHRLPSRDRGLCDGGGTHRCQWRPISASGDERRAGHADVRRCRAGGPGGAVRWPWSEDRNSAAKQDVLQRHAVSAEWLTREGGSVLLVGFPWPEDRRDVHRRRNVMVRAGAAHRGSGERRSRVRPARARQGSLRAFAGDGQRREVIA